ncbi:L-alanine-DL-glutamate epimerase [Devosia lucknowensis]|uniref:Dipeptide epimerase n=1 Tax=Devosia lucknowensis TaxID=1096929 RepID=A0A1Y6G5L6_9HYPH|nr:N-acetyl-D-Glu racemase DgcA [Devosia lucknowensis]SMQ85356.1 L-alanine-DL-glutamate epimerase [Devosia lucknowensis]
MSAVLTAAIERFPIAGNFTIARGSKTEALVVSVRLERHGHIGRGECTPYARYGETPETTLAAIEALAPAIADGMTRQDLQSALPPGAARNALDCAFWDLEAKQAGTSVAMLAGIALPKRIETAFTISLGTPDAMADAAAKVAHLPLLKIKLGAAGDAERLGAVRAAAPGTRLVVDANEGWHVDDLEVLLDICRHCRVELVEQPLPAGSDAALASIEHSVPICADESVHALDGLEALAGRYDAINIKLDKTGGLTEALAVASRAEALGLSIMVGCMVSTSLSMLPARLLASRARWVDLDGPLLLAEDRPDGLVYHGGAIQAGASALWGG